MLHTTHRVCCPHCRRSRQAARPDSVLVRAVAILVLDEAVNARGQSGQYDAPSIPHARARWSVANMRRKVVSIELDSKDIDAPYPNARTRFQSCVHGKVEDSGTIEVDMTGRHKGGWAVRQKAAGRPSVLAIQVSSRSQLTRHGSRTRCMRRGDASSSRTG